MERLVRFGALGGNMNIGGTPSDSNQVDTSETVYISSLALLKMLKHGRAGVPMEVGFKFVDWTNLLFRLWALCLVNLWMSIRSMSLMFLQCLRVGL